MENPRRRDATTTRADLLSAARRNFSEFGFDRVSLRTIAAEVGVDPALVIRYFGTKAHLFAEAAEFDLHLPSLRGVPREELADVLLPRFFEVWEDPDGGFLSLLRASTTSQRASERMLELFAEQVAPTFAEIAVDRPRERAALFGSQVLGLAMARYVLCVPPIVAMTRAELQQWVAPVLRRYLFEPLS
jgi:AcrR family transcriptional regulator